MDRCVVSVLVLCAGESVLASEIPVVEVHADQTIGAIPRIHGTVNGPLPSAGELKGKVVVVNCWATWCPKCHTGMPDLVKLHKKYGEKGVLFIGLTAEDEDALDDINGFMKKYGIEWPNAYGAIDSSLALKAEYIPRYWVIDRTGKVVWNVASSGEMGEAIEEALADQG